MALTHSCRNKMTKWFDAFLNPNANWKCKNERHIQNSFLINIFWQWHPVLHFQSPSHSERKCEVQRVFIFRVANWLRGGEFPVGHLLGGPLIHPARTILTRPFSKSFASLTLTPTERGNVSQCECDSNFCSADPMLSSYLASVCSLGYAILKKKTCSRNKPFESIFYIHLDLSFLLGNCEESPDVYFSFGIFGVNSSELFIFFFFTLVANGQAHKFHLSGETWHKAHLPFCYFNPFSQCPQALRLTVS